MNADSSTAQADLREPPATWLGALRQIGPGIILAGSIIGTGELLVTTRLGAESGFAFLWLILFSCVIKVFVQIELGRYTISSGKPTLTALDGLPGIRIGWRSGDSRLDAHWLVWWWFGMMLCTIFQLGAMVGGCGQALNLAFPALSMQAWGACVAAAAVLLLLTGGYRKIEFLTTLMVACVTLLTVACAIGLNWTDYPVAWQDLRDGMRPWVLPAASLTTAFAVFGITGVGASELYAYPYWCREKGWPRWTGPCTDDEAWARRARGWMRVMHLDAWVSMLVFTVATVAFYAMGASVLHARKIVPEKHEMIAQLSSMYVDAFGPWTEGLFLIGAGIVLFKTLYVASAGNSRLVADMLALSGAMRDTSAENKSRVTRRLCVAYPSLALILYLLFGDPAAMTVVGGVAQAMTLPIIAGAAVYLRYRRVDRRIAPSWIMDAGLLTGFALMAIFAAYQTVTTLIKL
jgi:Mn2+/Fe2+ NRAMP family transporter